MSSLVRYYFQTHILYQMVSVTLYSVFFYQKIMKKTHLSNLSTNLHQSYFFAFRYKIMTTKRQRCHVHVVGCRNVAPLSRKNVMSTLATCNSSYLKIYFDTIFELVTSLLTEDDASSIRAYKRTYSNRPVNLDQLLENLRSTPSAMSPMLQDASDVAHTLEPPQKSS